MRIVWFEEMADAPVDEVGRKAKNLAALRAGGYRVCEGAALNAETFREFCSDNGLTVAARTPERILAGRLSEEIKEALEAVFTRLCREGGELIARSSALEEDGAERSYAGIFESRLHIADSEQLGEAVKAVWASYYSPSAAAYRRDHPDGESMAVLIQRLLPCEISGILFTRNPVDGRDELVVEYTEGLNDGITDGTTAAARCLVNKRTGEIFPGERAPTNKPPRALIKKLLDVGKRLERAFGFPCDVEWGWKGGKLWLFQLRPMAVRSRPLLYTECTRDDMDAILLDRYAQPACVCYLSLLDSWQSRVYLSLYENRPGQSCDETPLAFIHNRVYWNIRYQRRYFEESIEQPAARRLLERRIVTGYRSWYRRLPRYERRIERLEEAVCQTKEVSGLLPLLEQTIDNFCLYIGVDHFRFLGIAQRLYKGLRPLCGGEETTRLAETLVGQYSMRNHTVAANEALQQMAAIIRQDASDLGAWTSSSPEELLIRLLTGGAPAALRQRFHEFLSIHGHRGVSCDDLYYPHWKEDPKNVIALLKQIVANDITDRAENDQDIKELEKTLVRRITEEKGGGRLGRGQVRRYLRLTGEYMRLRENQRYFFDKSWVLLRRILLRIGARLAEEGRLQSEEEIFHLTIDEVRCAAGCSQYRPDAAVIACRKRRFLDEPSQSPPYMIKASQRLSVQKGEGFARYKGLGISAGTATGPIQSIRRLEDLGAVRKGCIGVVDTFHPSWTPVLGLVSGLIMSYGNMLSHGAVVAREYGIPVVVFNGEALRAFTDGDVVEIYGDTGRIRVVERLQPESKSEKGGAALSYAPH